MALSDEDNTSLAVYVGPEAYNQWKALMTDQGFQPEAFLERTLANTGCFYLTAAAVLDSLADPSKEAVVESKNRGKLDTKGQCAEWREKARTLRSMASVMNFRMGFAGFVSGGSGIAAFQRSDPPLSTGEGLGEDGATDWNRGGVGE